MIAVNPNAESGNKGRTWKLIASSLLLLIATWGSVTAQSYPVKPIRMVVPYAPGGPADTVGRLLSERLSHNLGQAIVVLNKDGAGTIIGTDYAAKSPPDGYTLLLNSTAIVMNTAQDRKLPYDLQRDLTPLAIYYVQPNVLVVHPAFAAGSIKQLIDYAKSNPGKLRYGSSGVGAAVHLYSELFASMAGVKLTHVPYKGVAPAMVDLLGGQIDLMFSGIAIAAPHVASGRLRPLGISTRERSSLMPEVVPLAEQGLPAFDVKTWYGLFVPARTPKNIIDRLNGEISKIVAARDFRERLAGLGGEAIAIGPDQFREQVTRELGTWRKTIRDADIRIE